MNKETRELSCSLKGDESGGEDDDPLEECLLGNDTFLVQESFCTQKELFDQVLSVNTWDNVLTEEQRCRLSELLPEFPVNDAEEKRKTLTGLFSGENFKFGNPASHFFNLLNGGYLSPEIAVLYKLNQQAVYREYRSKQNDYHVRLLKQVLISRKKLLDAVNMLPPDEPVKMQQFSTKPKIAILSERTRLRYFSTLQEVREETGELDTSSEDEIYPDCSPPKVTKKHKKQLQNLEASLSPEMTRVTSTVALPSGRSGLSLNRCLEMIEVTEDRYREMLITHKKRKQCKPNHPILNVTDITLDAIMKKVNLSKRPLVKTESHSKKKAKSQENVQKAAKISQSSNEKPMIDVKPQLSHKVFFPNNAALNGDIDVDLQLPVVLGNIFQQQQQHQQKKQQQQQEPQPLAKTIKIEIKEEPIEEERLSPDPEVPQFPTCFFSLLRDFFCECPENKLSASKLEEKVRSWQDRPMEIYMYNWLHYQPSWVELVSSALRFLAGDLISILPEDFVPYLDYKEKQQQWQWIGSGRDSEEQMSALCQHWLCNKDNVSLDILETCQGSPPPPRVTTIWTVRATTDEEKIIYWEQEQIRYRNPHKAFTFKVHGYESVVGPVKGVYGKESGANKAREHSLLVSDRPPFVTILSLVRDAAARLPNGQGTRADICELLKDSQYLALASDQQIHTVVSGALDRLHYEKDPCVKYDVNRKLWIYLHRNRTEGEFERIHQAQAAAVKARRSVQKKQPPKSKFKEILRNPLPNITSSTMEERVAALLNVDVAAAVNSISTSHSPRVASPRTQGSPKLSHPKVNKQLLRQISAVAQAKASTAAASITENKTVQRKSDISPVASISLSLPDVATSACSPQHPISTGVTHLTSEGNNSRPPSQGSVQSLPSPKTVIANVNAAQFLGVGTLQVGSVSNETPVSSSANSHCLGVLSVDMKPSSPSFVGQPPVLQPVLSHQTIITTPSLNSITTAVAPTFVSSVSSTAPTPKTNKLIAVPSTSKVLPSFQTIVIKPDTTGRSSSNLSSLPVISMEDLNATDSSLINGNPVVARLLQGSQLLSLGNLVASSTAGNIRKQTNPSLQNIKIQGTEFVQQVLPNSNVNLFPSSGSSEIKLPRLTLMNQESNVQDASSNFISSSSAGQSSIFPQGVFSLAETRVTSSHKRQPEVKRVLTVASQNPRQSSTADLGQFIECGNISNHIVTDSTSVASCTTHSLNAPLGKSSVVIATQENLKPLAASTYVMSAPITNASLIANQQGLRAANTVNVRALQGIKVIPVSQSIGGNKNFRSTPLLARIISPSAGLALRSSVSGELVQGTQQLKTAATMNILHGLQSVNQQLLKGGTSGSHQDVPSSQPFIIQVQAPKNTDGQPNL